MSYKHRILILAANPRDTPDLRLGEEVQRINNALQRSRDRDQFEIRQVWASQHIDVRRALLDCRPTIVHFCGHGSEDGIAFEDETGYTKSVSSETLGTFFYLFANTVECVVLNACYSEMQATAIAKNIKYVIGMDKAISNTAAKEFSDAFYDALGAGQDYQFAYKLACNAIQWAGLPEHLKPVLKQQFPTEEEAKKRADELKISIQQDGTYVLSHGYILHGQKASYIVKRLPTERTLNVSYIAEKAVYFAETREQFFIKSIRIDQGWTNELIETNIRKLTLHIQNELDKSERLHNVKNIGRAVDSGGYEILHNGIMYTIPFLVQTYIEGRNLDKYISEKLTKPEREFRGIENWSAWYEFTKNLFIVLGEVHKAGVAHGDIQPKNIIVNKNNEVYLVDFGHAFLLNLYFAETTDPVEYSTVAYVAPEKRHRASYGTTASDIYSVGGILYKMATGEDPPEPQAKADSLETKFALKETVINSIKRRNPVLYNECPGVADVIIQCLHYAPQERARHTDDVLNVLDAFSYATNPNATVDPEDLVRLAKDVSNEILNFCLLVGSDSVQRNELFGRIFQLNLQRVLRSLKDMAGGDLVEISGSRDEIISGFLTYLSILKRYDRYVTTTIPRFWLPGNLGINGRFLRMNELLATKHQMSIRRVFLISEKDREMPHFAEIISAQKEVVARLKERGVDTDSKLLQASGYYTGYVEVPEDKQREFFINQGHHVGLVQNFNERLKQFDHSVSLIFDTEGLDEAIRRIVLWKVTPERADRILDSLQTLLQESKPISKFEL